MNDIKKNLNMLGASLSLRAKRNEILASNIANAATPHFKARDIDFDTEIKKYQQDGPIKVTHDTHLSIKKPVAPGKVVFRKNVNPSLDGNTVELAVEQLQFAENSMRYQSTLSFLNGKIDLTQAESINQLINASNARSAELAFSGVQGEIKKKINDIKNDLINQLCEIEARVDFEEDFTDFDYTNYLKNIKKVKEKIE